LKKQPPIDEYNNTVKSSWNGVSKLDNEIYT